MCIFTLTHPAGLDIQIQVSQLGHGDFAREEIGESQETHNLINTFEVPAPALFLAILPRRMPSRLGDALYLVHRKGIKVMLSLCLQKRK